MRQTKKVEKNRKKLLTSDQASDIICKLTRERKQTKKKFKKTSKKMKKVLDKRIASVI